MRRICGRVRNPFIVFHVATALWCAGAHAQILVHFDLPEQSLAQSLKAIGTATNTDVGFNASQIAGLVAPPLKADLTVDDALTRVLKGTGLQPQHLDDHTIVIGAAKAPLADSSQTRILLPKAAASADADSPVTTPLSPTPSDVPIPLPSSLITQKTDLGEIVVTGTHIAGSAPVGSPVITVTAADIENTGYSNIGDVIRSIPQAFGGGINPGSTGTTQAFANQNASYATTVNLRGLGSDSTLTLVDGHRLASEGVTSAVDITVIPLAAIERVEIMTDSASSVYGSDAVAGVANFILKKDFEGAQTSARYGAASNGGASEREVDQLFGTNWSGGNVLFNYEHDGQNELSGFDRSYSSEAGPQSLLPSQKRDSLFVSARQSLSDSISTYLEGIYSNRRTGSTTNFAGVDFESSPLEIDDTRTKLYSVSTGLKGDLGGNWTTSVDGTVSSGRNAATPSEETSGVSSSLPLFFYANRSASIEADAAGPLFNLPSGPILAAFGAGYRSEGYHDDDGTEMAKRHVDYGFVEFRIPIVRPDIDRIGLEQFVVSASGRSEHYSDFGSTSNPKLGLLYVPVKSLSFRGSWGTSFRAPDLYQEYSPTYLYVYNASYFGVTSPANAQALVESGGNRGLRPETARSWTVGLDFSPEWAPTLRAHLTYYDIVYRSRITLPFTNDLDALSNPIYAPYVSLNPSAAAQAASFAQATSTGSFANGPYNPSSVVATVDEANQNVDSQHTHGVDLTSIYRIERRFGNLDLSINVAWMRLQEAFTPTSPVLTLSGTIFNPPTFRSRFGATWHRGAWSASSFVNYVSSETDNAAPVPVRVASWTTVDGLVSYDATNWGGPLRGIHVSVAAQNLFNRDPPGLGATSTAIPSLSYDGTNASPLGRFISVILRKDW